MMVVIAVRRSRPLRVYGDISLPELERADNAVSDGAIRIRLSQDNKVSSSSDYM